MVFECTLYWCSLYSGRLALSGGMNFTLHNDNSFTLTCISTGGPATTVTWTRDSTTVTQGTQTVLNDGVTAQYIHTLNVTERIKETYKCTVANKFSEVEAELIVQGETNFFHGITELLMITPAPSPPSDVRASQNGLNSLLVTWTPSEGPNVTGYTVIYQQIDGKQNGLVAANNTDTINITGLIAGASFSIGVLANSSTLPSIVTYGPTVTIQQKGL